MLDSLFSNIDVLQTSLHGLQSRTRAIGENIANADTPGYKRLEVAYEAQLRKALKEKAKLNTEGELPLKTESGRHFALGPHGGVKTVAATMHQVVDEAYRNDQNNVDVEIEMAKLAETNIRFNTMATLARDKFDGIKNVLREIR